MNQELNWCYFEVNCYYYNHFYFYSQRTEKPDIILEVYHPYGTQKENTLDVMKDIRDASELKFNKNPLPKDIVPSENVNSNQEKK